MTIIMQKKLERAIDALRQYGAKEIYLFGSLGTDQFDEQHSDIDLAITGLPPEKFYKAMGETMLIFERPVDLIDLDEPSVFVNHLRSKGTLRRVA